MNTPGIGSGISKSTEVIVRKAYFRLLPVQILGIVVAAVNGFIDSIVTGRFLGTEALAAIGFFGPVTTVIGITWVVTTGVQVLCSKYIGSGDRDRVVSLFSTGAVFLAGFSLIVTAVCLIGRAGLSAFLGARGDTAALLSAYILGYAPGIIGQVLSGVLMVFLPFNNDTKRSYLGIGTMVVSNIGMDLLNVTVLHWGCFGMGIATSVSYLLSSAVMLAGFIGESHTIHLRLRGLCFGQLPRAAYLGLPSLMFTVGCTLKGYVINLSLMQHIGDAAVAVMNVQNNVIAILGAVPLGCAGAYLTLASLYYGDEDRHSLIDLTRLTLRYGMLFCAVVVAGLMLCASLIPSLFFARTSEGWEICRRMLLIFPNYLLINLLFNVWMKVYQCQGRMLLVNILTCLETVGTAVIAVLLVPRMGADGVWCSFSMNDLICLAVVMVSVFLWARRVTFRLADWMKLPADFGASADECVEFSLHSMEEVINISERVVAFCRERQVEDKRAMLAGLAIEEMAGNVVVHGFLPGEPHAVDVRIVVKEGMTIRIRDDCRAFDPQRYLEQFTPEDPTKNIGIRMITGMAREVSYQNNAGINTLLVKV